MKFLINYLKKITPIILLLFFSTGLMAQDGDKDYIRTTEKNTVYEIMGWETNITYNPLSYTWYSWKEPLVNKSTTQTVDMVPISDFDRPPVFNDYCLTQKDMFECSSKEMQKYIANNKFDYPDAAERKGQEGLEYVTFTLNENGKFEGNLRVLSKDNPCKGCADAAADIVASMEDMWYPAILDGKPVKTQLTLPVKFKLFD